MHIRLRKCQGPRSRCTFALASAKVLAASEAPVSLLDFIRKSDLVTCEAGAVHGTGEYPTKHWQCNRIAKHQAELSL